MILLVCFRNFHYKKENPNVESQSYATKIQIDFLEKENKDCYKSSKIKIYKLNCQSSSFPLSASLVTYPSKPHRQFLFAFCVSNSIIMFFGEVEVGVCETMDRTATVVFWVGGPRSYPEARGHFLWNLETDFVWIWEFLCSAATIGIKLNLISISLYKIWN